jgi:hypothetical protein
MVTPPNAAAAIQELEEAPGQRVYQSRQALVDQEGHRWQVIAFKRIRSGEPTRLDLRLVGFPGVVTIDHSQPLILTNSLGKTLTAAEVSSEIFGQARQPEPNVGQYDLEPLLSQLQAEIPLTLTLPIRDGLAVTLSVPPSWVQEWQAIASRA